MYRLRKRPVQDTMKYSHSTVYGNNLLCTVQVVEKKEKTMLQETIQLLFCAIGLQEHLDKTVISRQPELKLYIYY